ncbi:MAG: NAD-dependent epimerase/dehydratase family protein [Dehalococcoidia bacterium]
MDATFLTSALRGVEAVCHLAGVGDVYLAAREPLTAVQGNVAATTLLLQSAAAAGVRRFVFASTWEVYGPPRYQPIDEEHPTAPDHPYNITKLGAEMMGVALSHSLSTPFVSLRLGTAYGGAMRASSVFRIFADRARSGQPLTIKGTGEQFRQFTHVDDIAEAFRLALPDAAPSGCYNIVAPEKTSIRQLAEALIARLGGSVVFEPARAADIAPSEVTARRAELALGWRAAIPFAEGLDRLLQDMA